MGLTAEAYPWRTFDPKRS